MTDHAFMIRSLHFVRTVARRGLVHTHTHTHTHTKNHQRSDLILFAMTTLDRFIASDSKWNPDKIVAAHKSGVNAVSWAPLLSVGPLGQAAGDEVSLSQL